LLELKAGDRVFGINEPSDEVYLVMSGRVEVRVPRRDGSDCEMVVDRFASGQLFGEVAMLAGETRKGNAIVLEPTSLLVLNREGIENAVRRYPLMASKLFLNMATDISQRWVRFIKRASNNEICAPALEDKRDE
jgi:CRP-like cAMP-binding protein